MCTRICALRNAVAALVTPVADSDGLIPVTTWCPLTIQWGFQYLIKWKDYPEEENTWEPEGNIPDNIIDAYWKTQPAKSQPKKFAQESNRKSRYDDDVEEVGDSESEEEAASTSKRRSGNGRKSAASSTKPSLAKKARLSTSSRRRSSSTEDEEEEEDEEDAETSARREADKARALEKVRVRFLDHYMKREDWDGCVDGIINMQRSEDDSQLQSFVQFEQSSSWTRAMDSIGAPEEADGKGPRIWVDNDVVNERCPQRVIKFYEQHVRFANPRAAR